jgi:hypothetical protein
MAAILKLFPKSKALEQIANNMIKKAPPEAVNQSHCDPTPPTQYQKSYCS